MYRDTLQHDADRSPRGGLKQIRMEVGVVPAVFGQGRSVPGWLTLIAAGIL